MPEDLLAALDPQRDYGERTHAEVVAAVKAGELKLEPGASLPMIRDARTNRVVAGTGRPPGKPAAVFSRALIQRRFAQNAQAIWEAAFKHGIEEGDPRWGKLLFEYGMGAPQQNKGEGSGATEFLRILAAAAESSRQARISVTDAE